MVALLRTTPETEFAVTVAPFKGLTWPYSFTVMVPFIIGSDPQLLLTFVTCGVVTFDASLTAAADVPAIASTNVNASINNKRFFWF